MMSTLATMQPEFLELERHMGQPIDINARRTLLLRQITWETRHGFLDGVEIDLRHSDLEAGEWDPIWYFGSSAYAHDADGPCLILPWSKEHWGYLPQRSSKPVIVRSGDRLRIAKIVRHSFDGSELSHPADREFRAAHLVVERANGRRAFVPRPLLFWPPLSLSRPRRFGRPNFDMVVARTCDALAVPDLDSFCLTDEILLTHAEAAFDAASNARSHWRRTLEAIDNPDGLDREGVQLWLRELVDSAVSLGYFAAQSETERFVEPHARRDLGRIEASEKGGRKSGAKRRDQASLWKNAATGMILEIMRKPGPHKREAVVFEVQSSWRWPSIKVPGDRSLWSLIKELSDSGTISF